MCVSFIFVSVRVFWMKATEISLANGRKRKFFGRTSGVSSQAKEQGLETSRNKAALKSRKLKWQEMFWQKQPDWSVRSLNANLFSASLIICFDLKSRVRTFNWPDLHCGLTLGLGRERSLPGLDPKERNNLYSKQTNKQTHRRWSSKGENVCCLASNEVSIRPLYQCRLSIQTG